MSEGVEITGSQWIIRYCLSVWPRVALFYFPLTAPLCFVIIEHTFLLLPVYYIVGGNAINNVVFYYFIAMNGNLWKKIQMQKAWI